MNFTNIYSLIYSKNGEWIIHADWNKKVNSKYVLIEFII